MNACSLCGSAAAGMVFSCLRCGSKYCAVHRPRSAHSCIALGSATAPGTSRAAPGGTPALVTSPFDTSYHRAREEAAGSIAAVTDLVLRARAMGLDVASYELGLRDARSALSLADPGHAILLSRQLGARLRELFAVPD